MICCVIPLDCQSVILVNSVCDYHGYLALICVYCVPFRQPH